MPWRSWQIILLPWGFLPEHLKFDSQILWCGSFFFFFFFCPPPQKKAILVLPKYFLNFRFYVVALYSIIDLGCFGCKGYTSVVLGYSEVILLGERNNVALWPSVCYVMAIYGIAVSEQYDVEFLCLLYFWVYFIKTCCFPICNFS